MNVSPDLLVEDVLTRWPQTLAVFTQNRMACPGCTMACFETLAEAASVYGLHLDCFLGDLQSSLSAKPLRPRPLAQSRLQNDKERHDGIHRRP